MTYNATAPEGAAAKDGSMKLYTKQGDDGETSLFGGQRVSKDNLRVTAYGEVDECNAAIGAAAASCGDDELRGWIQHVQSDLFSLGAMLATPSGSQPAMVVADEDVARLESWIDAAVSEVPPLQQFVLPGGSPAAALLHLARTVCRRAERAVVTLAESDVTDGVVIRYLNRLSDLLFAWARLANHRSGVPDVPWAGARGSGGG